MAVHETSTSDIHSLFYTKPTEYDEKYKRRCISTKERLSFCLNVFSEQLREGIHVVHVN